MSAYITPIKSCPAGFSFPSIGDINDFFVIQYRKYGRFILSRALVLYSFVFYLLCAYFLVILPLPSIEEVAQMTGPKMELQLGGIVATFCPTDRLKHSRSTNLSSRYETRGLF